MRREPGGQRDNVRAAGGGRLRPRRSTRGLGRYNIEHVRREVPDGEQDSEPPRGARRAREADRRRRLPDAHKLEEARACCRLRRGPDAAQRPQGARGGRGRAQGSPRQGPARLRRAAGQALPHAPAPGERRRDNRGGGRVHVFLQLLRHEVRQGGDAQLRRRIHNRGRPLDGRLRGHGAAPDGAGRRLLPRGRGGPAGPRRAAGAQDPPGSPHQDRHDDAGPRQEGVGRPAQGVRHGAGLQVRPHTCPERQREGPPSHEARPRPGALPGARLPPALGGAAADAGDGRDRWASRGGGRGLRVHAGAVALHVPRRDQPVEVQQQAGNRLQQDEAGPERRGGREEQARVQGGHAPDGGAQLPLGGVEGEGAGHGARHEARDHDGQERLVQAHSRGGRPGAVGEVDRGQGDRAHAGALKGGGNLRARV